MSDKVLKKQIGWCTGMLCDLTDMIDQCGAKEEYDQVNEFLYLLKEEVQKLDGLIRKIN